MRLILISTCLGLILLTRPGTQQAQEKRRREVEPRPKLSPEADLIYRASGWPWGHGPHSSSATGLDVIRAVNALQRLGKEQALARLEEYLAWTSIRPPFDRRRSAYDEPKIVFWIVRLLFEPADPARRNPSPAIAVFLLDNDSRDQSLWPLEPLELINDIPFMVGHGTFFGGQEEHPASHIEWVRRNSIMRTTPLIPSQSPLAAAEALLTSPKFRRLDAETRRQATTSIRTHAYRMSPEVPKSWPEYNDQDDEQQRQTKFDRYWRSLLDQEREQKIAWDPQAEKFVAGKK
ncbi:MAG: hypothetical protein JWN70_5350 [Planctomycetaceae bacterium]|nr:hypothetical protein [Planctomycetaceae bacterium]